MISKVLTNTAETVQSYGMLYKLVAQKVLLYGSESWMVMGEILKVLEDFHHWVARKITAMTTRHTEGGEC